MGIGIVVTAHHYYVSFGGQGYLMARTNSAALVNETAKVYIPLRKIASFGGDGIWSRISPMEVPYYACGDQENSCEAYNQPASSPYLHQQRHESNVE
jgi:hypothetical protein